MPCSYTDIAVPNFDQKALEYPLSPTVLKTFRVDAFVLWPHGKDTVSLFLDHTNASTDPTEKIRFTMEAAESRKYLEFIDLQLKGDMGK